MSTTFSEQQLRQPIWLFAHSTPENWKAELKDVLDPLHPTRHSIWTSVADSLQEKVFDDGPKMRLDESKLLFRNAFSSAQDVRPKLDFGNPSLKKQKDVLSKQIGQYKPRVILTFGDEAYRFVSFAQPDCQIIPLGRQKIENLGDKFRDALKNFCPENINVIPLLHASVARASWFKAGEKFSGPEGEKNYFKYVGKKLGELLLSYGRAWPIWR